VALAAIKGLNEILQQKDTEIRALRAENEVLAKRLQAVEHLVKRLMKVEVGRDH